MSKIKLLLDVVNDLKSLADSVQAVANAMSENEVLPAEEVQTEATENPTVPIKSTVTLEQVRGVLADKSRMGFTEQVRELLQKHGADKLSSINPIEYSALLAEAEVLGNAT